MTITQGNYQGQGLKITLVMSRFNDMIGKQLLEGAKDGLIRHGVLETNIHIVYAPGAYELPLVVDRIITKNKPDAVIALGAVIRGATPHFDMVANEVTKGLASVSLDTKVPVINAVLTTDSIEQAIERAGTKAGNKGFDAAMAAIEMANLIKNI